MTKSAPTGTLGLASPSGWMNNQLFFEVMKHLIKFSSSSKVNSLLLIYDNHESHLSINVIDLAKENGVTILTIHPHCSHKLQSLDVSVYSAFKSYYAAAMDSLLLERPGQPVTIYGIAKLVNTAHERPLTPSNIISGFKRTDIYLHLMSIFSPTPILIQVL